LNGVNVQTNQIAGKPTGPTPPTKVNFCAVFPRGTNVIQITVSDGSGNVVSCESTLTVLDRIAPLITSATATPNVLWPPNHKLVDVKLNVSVRDLCGSVTWKILSVTSNEADNGLGDGDTSPDWEIVDDHCVRLRAERSGKGAGRTYTICVQAQDAAGNRSLVRRILVTVPKSHGKDKWPEKEEDKGKDEDKGNGNGNGNGNGKEKGK